MVGWSSIERVFDLLIPVCLFYVGFSVCLSLFLRIFITKFSLDVRDLTPRLQALVMLDNLLPMLLVGGRPEFETSYSRSIRTGLSLKELKDLDDAEFEASRPEREAKLAKREAKDARSHSQAVSIMKGFFIFWMSLIGGTLLVLFVTSLF